MFFSAIPSTHVRTLIVTAADMSAMARSSAAARSRAMRAARVETAMSGRPWTPTWLADIDAVLARDFTPIGDHRGSAAYRLRAAAGLLRRFQHETSSTRPVRVEAI